MGGKVVLDTTLDLTDKSKPLLVFKTTVPKDQWFAIGFGTSMKDTDMVVWQARDDG
jgi:hypothetical protein